MKLELLIVAIPLVHLLVYSQSASATRCNCQCRNSRNEVQVEDRFLRNFLRNAALKGIQAASSVLKSAVGHSLPDLSAETLDQVMGAIDDAIEDLKDRSSSLPGDTIRDKVINKLKAHLTDYQLDKVANALRFLSHLVEALRTVINVFLSY